MRIKECPKVRLTFFRSDFDLVFIFLEILCLNGILSFMRIVLTCTRNTEHTDTGDDDHNMGEALEAVG